MWVKLLVRCGNRRPSGRSEGGHYGSETTYTGAGYYNYKAGIPRLDIFTASTSGLRRASGVGNNSHLEVVNHGNNGSICLWGVS